MDDRCTSNKIGSTRKSSEEDSNAIDIVFEKRSGLVLNEKSPKKEIECICLDDSDSDVKEEPSGVQPQKEISKKIDFFNLESSDTDDDEQENIQNSVDDLLTSASILNDVESGPSKPIQEPYLASSPSCSNDTSTGIKRSFSSLSSTIDQNNDTDRTDDIFPSTPDHNHFSSENIDCKRKKNSQSEENSQPIEILDLDVTDNNEPDRRLQMYREDKRICNVLENKVSRIPWKISQIIPAHESAVSTLSWCPLPYSHLLLSSSNDSMIKIWDIYSENVPIQSFKLEKAVRAASWSKSGEQVLAGGFDKKLHVIDALSGLKHNIYDIYNYVSCIAIHPEFEEVFLCGTKNAVLAFDLKINSNLPVRIFGSNCEEVLDIAFLNEKEFACTTSLVSRDSSDRTIMVWDFSTGAILSNQIFLERYTCPSLKVNPYDSTFVAQTNGNYIAKFSTQRPYKMKNVRYQDHMVSGFGIECDISPDGQFLASGDALGDVCFYDYATTATVTKETVKKNIAVNRLKWHPVLCSTIATATWDGHIQIWK
ncbi:WD repeat-containing protein 25 [Caerostris darwini]|uniref:WD repeat-containing protein 25 n=1 Tax=Caerostris darwini TaxID=1538125 RepID=A0AAV4X1P8_9ARAC|nr:WD repeat-containing protein 25 [Caerostris darwini]